MHVFYCKKCKKDSLTPICEHCGQPITALSSNERLKWRAIRVPLGDARSIWGALKVLALAEIPPLFMVILYSVNLNARFLI